jgi:hypothetical protein
MSALWDDPNIKECIKRLDSDTKAKYKRLGDAMYNRIDFCDPETTNAESATQIELMLRDGIKPDMLTDDERALFIQIRGEKELEKYK